jgi:xanthine dehydrogenase molybdenum-binding subunit
MKTLNTVGHPEHRIDAELRVTGGATYTGDLKLPGMLYARVLRSPHPHARIKKLDRSKAAALPGVRVILTRDDTDVTWASGDSRNKRYLFNNPARFAGDAVAAVAAVDRHVAEEAIRLIEVEYETLPFVLDPEEALKAGAPEIQPGGNLSPTPRGEHVPDVQKRGNVEAGFAAADHVFEDHYSSPHINNAQMEPRVAIATWEGEKLTVYTPTQGIANCRTDIAKDLKMSADNVRVVCRFMGGGFGNKNQNHDFELMAAVLSKKAGVPVRIEFTRKEDFISVHGRWPTKQYYKVGVKNDGTLTAIQMRGYSNMGPYRKGQGDIAGLENWACPNTERTLNMVYTNMAVSANLRGPAYPQGVFGIGSMMDHVSHELKMDPVEFHLKNMTRKLRDETPYTSYGLEDCVVKGAEAFKWKERWKPAGTQTGVVRSGVGLGIGVFNSSIARSDAILKLDSSGLYTLYVGVTDIGTAAKTTMGMIAAEELGVELAKVRVVNGDTETCPYSVGESGSRTTTHTGWAVVEAARALKKLIAEKGLPAGSEERRVAISTDPKLNALARYSFVAHFAQVDVDTETGHVRVTDFLGAHDSGRIVNPLTAESQVKGGVTMGLGMALHEELRYDKKTGLPVSAGYYGARIPTHMDAPEVRVMFVETEDAYGPFGAKTIGELTIIGVVAAVGNAVFNAIGKRVKDLPITREKVLEVLA